MYSNDEDRFIEDLLQGLNNPSEMAFEVDLSTIPLGKPSEVNTAISPTDVDEYMLLVDLPVETFGEGAVNKAFGPGSFLPSIHSMLLSDVPA